MADTIDDGESGEETTPNAEPKDKNLQLKATETYQKAVLALAKAHGYKTIADYLQFLLDRELATAHAQIAQLKNDIDQRYAQEADREKAELDAALAPAPKVVRAAGTKD